MAALHLRRACGISKTVAAGTHETRAKIPKHVSYLCLKILNLLILWFRQLSDELRGRRFQVFDFIPCLFRFGIVIQHKSLCCDGRAAVLRSRSAIERN